MRTTVMKKKESHKQLWPIISVLLSFTTSGLLVLSSIKERTGIPLIAATICAESGLKELKKMRKNKTEDDLEDREFPD